LIAPTLIAPMRAGRNGRSFLIARSIMRERPRP
jgi:hypothetical protein